MSKSIIYLWRVKNNSNKVIHEGVLENDVDVSIDDLIPEFNTYSNRSLWEIQTFIDHNYSNFDYKFEYQTQEIEWKS